eukprot:465981-Prymnesium_polylepis.1
MQRGHPVGVVFESRAEALRWQCGLRRLRRRVRNLAANDRVEVVQVVDMRIRAVYAIMYRARMLNEPFMQSLRHQKRSQVLLGVAERADARKPSLQAGYAVQLARGPLPAKSAMTTYGALDKVRVAVRLRPAATDAVTSLRVDEDESTLLVRLNEGAAEE